MGTLAFGLQGRITAPKAGLVLWEQSWGIPLRIISVTIIGEEKGMVPAQYCSSYWWCSEREAFPLLRLRTPRATEEFWDWMFYRRWQVPDAKALKKKPCNFSYVACWPRYHSWSSSCLLSDLSSVSVFTVQSIDFILAVQVAEIWKPFIPE